MSRPVAHVFSAAALLALAGSATLTGVPGAMSAHAAPLPAAAVPTSLPAGCQVVVGEATGQAYIEGRKISTWTTLDLPKKGPRFTEIELEGYFEDDSWHHLAVDADGRAYDVPMDATGAGLGDGWNLDALVLPKKPIGTTLKGIIDLEAGAEMVDDEGWAVAPRSRVYAVTSAGRLYSIPMTYTKQKPRLGAPVELRAKGLGGLRGIEAVGRYWKNGKITTDLLFGHTRDGRLLEVRVDRTRATPRVTYKQMAKGWGTVSALAVGFCDKKPHTESVVVVAIDSSKRVTAYLDPVWDDASLRGAKRINLGTWKRGPLSTLF